MADGGTKTRDGAAASRRFELMVAGLGGQGALLATQILVNAGLGEFEHVTWFPSYATFVRGGACEGTAILSDAPIHSPLVYRPGALIVMSPSSLRSFEERIGPGCMLILDSTLVTQWEDREGVCAFRVPATQKATELGSTQSANLLLLGFYLGKTKVLELGRVEEVLSGWLARDGKEDFLASNLEALRQGYSRGVC